MASLPVHPRDNPNCYVNGNFHCLDTRCYEEGRNICEELGVSAVLGIRDEAASLTEDGEEMGVAPIMVPLVIIIIVLLAIIIFLLRHHILKLMRKGRATGQVNTGDEELCQRMLESTSSPEAELSRLRSELLFSETLRAELSSEVSRMHQRISQLEEESSELVSIRDKFQKVEVDLRETRIMMDEVNMEMVNMQRRSDEMEKGKCESEAALKSEFERQAAEAKQRLDKVKKEAAEAKKRADVAEMSASKFRTRAERAMADWMKPAAELDKLREELCDMEKKSCELRDRSESLESEKAGLSAKVQELGKNVAALEAPETVRNGIMQIQRTLDAPPLTDMTRQLSAAAFLLEILEKLNLVTVGSDFTTRSTIEHVLHYLNRPEPLRACLYQVVNMSREAFKEGYASMEQIVLDTGTIREHMENAVRLHLRAVPEEKVMLPSCKNSLHDIAVRCQTESKSIVRKGKEALLAFDELHEATLLVMKEVDEMEVLFGTHLYKDLGVIRQVLKLLSELKKIWIEQLDFFSEFSDLVGIRLYNCVNCFLNFVHMSETEKSDFAQSHILPSANEAVQMGYIINVLASFYCEVSKDCILPLTSSLCTDYTVNPLQDKIFNCNKEHLLASEIKIAQEHIQQVVLKHKSNFEAILEDRA